jgi:hypothetical protein
MSDGDLRQKVIAVFEAELPKCARVLDLRSILAEVEGREPDHEWPTEEMEDTYLEVLGPLVEEDILQVGEVIGCEVFGLTIAYQDEFKAKPTHGEHPAGSGARPLSA